MNIEEGMKQNSKSKSSFARIVPKESNENDELDQEQNNCESPEEKNQQTL